ncbi:hypothetical protein CROQUDRAFT_653188 [Cronartium quercuum f. sp. fusiforme G11]|uniref:Uncharacterized protein n=1 Tax=Cronartium quercuum f. sp. fusiforme G11 TaxID=708437 RepID=A0A9P6NT93_9BASI|nr:hypothetical protein CROQUDRAFT_653188 [Cronartium quercuum f. sp. fusiforme G11]
MIKKHLSENPGCLGDRTIMPNPLNSSHMFKVNGLAMLSTPPNNEEFCLEFEKGLI